MDKALILPLPRQPQLSSEIEAYGCLLRPLQYPQEEKVREREREELRGWVISESSFIFIKGRRQQTPFNQTLPQALVKECESALERVLPFWPQLAMDGVRNLWIVKPGAQSRGRGIFMMNNLEEILALVQSPLIYETKYVVQKYMGKPAELFS